MAESAGLNSVLRIAAHFQRVCAEWDQSVAAKPSPDENRVWQEIAACLLRALAAGRFDEFESGFAVVSDWLNQEGARPREVALPHLFGEFTRRAIALKFDRTRFVAWLGPSDLLRAPKGLVRGRVLYFARSRGKVLGADGRVYFVHRMDVLRPDQMALEAGQLVEFQPCESLRGPAVERLSLLAEDGSRAYDSHGLVRGKQG